MKTMVIYDSLFGNTKQIAHTIGQALGSQEDVQILPVNNVRAGQLGGLTLIIIGSPTQGGRPTPALRDFLNKVSESTIGGVDVATFDTRFSTKMVKIFGYAAERIAETLHEKKCNLIVPPEGFLIKGKKGPLKEGELERAASWAKGIVKK